MKVVGVDIFSLFIAVEVCLLKFPVSGKICLNAMLALCLLRVEWVLESNGFVRGWELSEYGMGDSSAYVREGVKFVGSC